MFLSYLIVINILGAFVFVLDKRRAVRGRRRIPEASLHGVALLGSFASMLLLMPLIRHKNRKPSFYGVTLVIAAAWLFAAYVMVVR